MNTDRADQPSPSPPTILPADIEQVLVGGDLAKLNPEQRLGYYRAVCRSLGLNELTSPFSYITLNGKLRLYALKDATDQLRKLHGVSITTIEKTFHEDLYIVTAYALDKTGRTDASTGAVMIKGLKGEALANALMKTETKAKRRVTLSICGLGMLDELEAEDINRPGVTVEAQTKVIDGKPVNLLTGEEVPQDGLLRVVSVTSRPTTTGRGCWLLKLSDGREAYTFREQESALAEACAQVSEPVIVETKETNRGLDVVSIRRVETEPAAAEVVAPESAPVPPVAIDASSIPF